MSEYNYGPLEHQMAGGTDRSEFDQVFDQMEAPEYPATCDNCGEVGTNASMGQHECDEHDASAAPERGDRWTLSKPLTNQILADDLRRGNLAASIYCIDVPEDNSDRIHFGAVVVFGDSERAAQIVTEHNQHSTLIAQRERLLEAARFALSTPGFIRGRDSLQRIVDEAITTSEQEGRTER